MVNIPQEVMDLLKSTESVNKSIATVNAQGVPNVANMGSINAIDYETVMIADMSTVHTRENLVGPNKKVVIALYKAPMTAYQIKGTFQGFQTSGPIFESWANNMKARGYPLPRGIGLIKVDEVYSSTPGANSKKLA